jgi:hypothetical protein
LAIDDDVVAHGAERKRENRGLSKADLAAVGLLGPSDVEAGDAVERKDARALQVVDLDESAVGSAVDVVLELEPPVAGIAIGLEPVQIAEESNHWKPFPFELHVAVVAA